MSTLLWALERMVDTFFRLTATRFDIMSSNDPTPLLSAQGISHPPPLAGSSARAGAPPALPSARAPRVGSMEEAFGRRRATEQLSACALRAPSDALPQERPRLALAIGTTLPRSRPSSPADRHQDGAGVAAFVNAMELFTLAELPGVGHTLARKMKVEQHAHGDFKSDAELQRRVGGLGPKRFENLSNAALGHRSLGA